LWITKFWTLVLSKTPGMNKSILQVENLLFSHFSNTSQSGRRFEKIKSLKSLFLLIYKCERDTNNSKKKTMPHQKSQLCIQTYLNKDNYKSNSIKIQRLNSLTPHSMSGQRSIFQVRTHLYDDRKPAQHLCRLNT